MSQLCPGSRYCQQLCAPAPELAEAEIRVRCRSSPSSMGFTSNSSQPLQTPVKADDQPFWPSLNFAVVTAALIQRI